MCCCCCLKGFEFGKTTTAISDLDNDNIGEITFAYRIMCSSDMSPWTLKLLTLENGDKYILRGTTKIQSPDEIYGGDLTVDDSFKNGPKEFLKKFGHLDIAELVYEGNYNDEFIKHLID